ncbi:MAG: hypothetical protein CMI02_12095 [Oceanospirillaceae bacterium]|nr:hypothetical protein [Oceanospirillaceae bacterium]MBT12761.1 hypothetical protein [Oceanospirillaceae bacterium]|tara:strand:- start:52900 stop:53412 length:513 start_codon:yes stop_codon:yes gene_type:complete
MTLILRSAEGHDRTALNELNKTATPHVDPLSEGYFHYLVEQGLCIVAENPLGLVEGYIVLVHHSEDFDGEDFRWFKDSSDEPFVYIDQVVVGPEYQGRGIASELYRCAEKYAAQVGAGALTCEIRLDPLNEESHHFHKEHDFEEIGRRRSQGHDVLLMKKAVSEEPFVPA